MTALRRQPLTGSGARGRQRKTLRLWPCKLQKAAEDAVDAAEQAANRAAALAAAADEAARKQEAGIQKRM